MTRKISATETEATCMDCAYISAPDYNYRWTEDKVSYRCNDGKRLVNPTDTACEHFKCKYCGAKRNG